MYETEFEIFYASYPLHKRRVDAFKAYEKQRKRGYTAQEMLKGVEFYSKEIREKKITPNFVKHAASWLNGCCWMDEQELKKVATEKPVARQSFRESDLARQIAEYEAQPRPKLRSAADIIRDLRAAKRTD